MRNGNEAFETALREPRSRHGWSGWPAGTPGDTRSVGDGISEIRLHYDPGYRIYFRQRGTTLILLLCGGDRGSQSRDIERAKELAKAEI